MLLPPILTKQIFDFSVSSVCLDWARTVAWLSMTWRFLKISEPTFLTSSLSSDVGMTMFTIADSMSVPALDLAVSLRSSSRAFQNFSEVRSNGKARSDKMKKKK